MNKQSYKISIIVFFGFLLSSILYGQIDTTGLRFYRPLYNSMKTWDEGAFNMNQKGHPDYGWGVYNSITHNLGGSTTYLLKLPSGAVKKISINAKNSISNIYNFTYSDINGSNSLTNDVRAVDYATNPKRLFIYYSIQNNALVDREPAYNSWDILLTRFHDNKIDYNVTGLLLNENIKASVYKAPDPARAINSTLQDTTKFSDSLTIIGNSWYKLQNMVMIPADSMVYFIKTDPDTIYKMIVNYFQSGTSGAGRVGIRSQMLRPSQGAWVFDTLTMGSGYANDVYFHFRKKTVKTSPRNNWDIAFKVNQMSASILANTTIGSTLYTYPNWYPVPVEETSVKATKIYPNPASGMVYLTNSEWTSDSGLSVQIYNINGQYIISGKRFLSGTELVLDFSEFPAGLYYFNISVGGKSYSGKILVSR